ncbi:MAG: DUF4968 domain-containing protein [Lachnospiraceae bacterium]|nr:DUF4968 domain-containing protein [Lachnospiraceae bacterium]
MLKVNSGISKRIKSIRNTDKGILFISDAATLFVGAVADNILHIRYFDSGLKKEPENKYSFVVAGEIKPDNIFKVEDNEAGYCLDTGNTVLKIDKENCALEFFDKDGRSLLSSDRECPYSLDRYELYKNDDSEVKVEKIKTPDGVKEKITSNAKIFDRYTYRCRCAFRFADEQLYGLGQFEHGYGSLRGQRLYLNQANRQIVIPYMVSTSGYGLLFNMHCPVIFNDTNAGSYIYASAFQCIDFYFVNGGSIAAAQKAYRFLTDKAAILPKWAYGYMQSQERYETQDEILEVANEYRKKGIGLDTIILDWCSWPDGQWGQKTMEKDRFPDPREMVKRLHEMDVHFMISIWPNMNECTDNYKEFKKNDLLLNRSDVYNAFSDKARALYWKQTNEGLYRYGIDAWWCDNSEPMDPSWTMTERPEPSRLFAEYINETSDHMDVEYSNTFAYFHALGVYEGQRSENAHIINEKKKDPVLWDKRLLNLTRSAYLGSQKFGTVMWSGDIDAKWSVLRKQIAAGLNFCASGMPYWTLDIGAFFIKHGDYWYWNGEYDKGFDDEAYKELFVRWYWYGAFLPVFRGHGTDIRRELWHCKNSDRSYYDSLLKANRLRYELFYYIYSYAGRIYACDETLMNPLAVDFCHDEKACQIFDQYMFGHEIMVCPVYEPIEKGKDTVKRKVYLPSGTCWYDYFTSCRFAGGQYITVEVPIDSIPVFVRDGSLIPIAKCDGSRDLSTASLSKDISVNVYGNGERGFILYDDEGDGYAYESGHYLLKKIEYDNAASVLSEKILNDGYSSDIRITEINLI